MGATVHEHKLTRDDIADYTPLAEDLGRKLGRDVAVLTRAATDDEPAALLVRDAVTGEPVTVDDKVLAQALAALEPSPPPVDPLTDAEVVAVRDLLTRRR